MIEDSRLLSSWEVASLFQLSPTQPVSTLASWPGEDELFCARPVEVEGQWAVSGVIKLVLFGPAESRCPITRLDYLYGIKAAEVILLHYRSKKQLEQLGLC